MAVYNNILLVDDSGGYREGAALLLKQARDYLSIAQAKYPEEAKKELLVQRPDLIFLDVDFEGRPLGLDFLEWLKAQPEYGDITVIMMTGHRLTMQQITEDLISRGAAGYIWKDSEGFNRVYSLALDMHEAGGNFFHGTAPAETGKPGMNRMQPTKGLKEGDMRLLALHCKGTSYALIASKLFLEDWKVTAFLNYYSTLFRAKNSKHLIWQLADNGVTFDTKLYEPIKSRPEFAAEEKSSRGDAATV